MKEWIKACDADDLPRGEGRTVNVNGEPVAVFRLDNGEVHAIGDECPHAYGSLGEGMLLDEVIVVCPLHGWSFDVRTGICEGDSKIRVRSFDVRQNGGQIQVCLQEDPEKQET